MAIIYDVLAITAIIFLSQCIYILYMCYYIHISLSHSIIHFRVTLRYDYPFDCFAISFRSRPTLLNSVNLRDSQFVTVSTYVIICLVSNFSVDASTESILFFTLFFFSSRANIARRFLRESRMYFFKCRNFSHRDFH